MQMLARNPAATYRRIELDARIEASGRGDLTRICLEEAEGALGQALIALDRSLPVPREPLARAQSIMVWLAQSVAPGHPLAATLRQFYGGLASQIGASLLHADAARLRQVMSDIRELLDAAG
jgi:flagellin-specific chaperone FliS